MWIYIIDGGLIGGDTTFHTLWHYDSPPNMVAHTFIHSPVSAVVNTIMIDLERNLTTRIARMYRAQGVAAGSRPSSLSPDGATGDSFL
jgi:hypothetical protein